MLVSAGSGVLVGLFVLFFLLKDGTGMWRWTVGTAPAQHRARLDEAGHRAWETTRHYVLGVVVIALADAVLIGAGLFVLGVPLVLSLSILVFLGAFVPFLGALVSGAVAALVTLVTNGPGAALIEPTRDVSATRTPPGRHRPPRARARRRAAGRRSAFRLGARARWCHTGR